MGRRAALVGRLGDTWNFDRLAWSTPLTNCRCEIAFSFGQSRSNLNMATSVILEKRVGIACWMEEVLDQCAKAEQNFSSDPVHDLRTALRRCRSMADGIRVFDRDSAWKKMRRAGKELFSSLGELRDTHVMMEWVEKLAPAGDPVGKTLLNFLVAREQESKNRAAGMLQTFDRRQWKNWGCRLPDRAARIPLDSPELVHLALERWHQAYTLHIRALRNRTNVAFHDLRIGIKRFRYTLENFLPSLYQSWGKDLKEIQDILGEIHDLDVLWQTVIRIKAFPYPATRLEWRTRIQEERHQRLKSYRAKMVGTNSLWMVWRRELPSAEECRPLGLERVRTWAGFLDPKITHSNHVARLALQLYDGLPIAGILRGSKQEAHRWILHAAALVHDVGRSRTNRGQHKVAARLVRKLEPPLGWTSGELRIAALVVRYHRGALPKATQKAFAALSPSRQRLVQFLGGILRLACACEWQRDNQIRRVIVESVSPVITVRAEGYIESTPLAEHIAAARHLLELTYRRPVFVLATEHLATEEKEKIQAQAA
jgi:CHAD domain-containing protein